MNRRDLLAALGAAGGLAVIADSDSDLFAPIVVDDGDDGDDGGGDTTTDTMTLDITQLSDVQSESGLLNISPGTSGTVSLGDFGTTYELLGAHFRRDPGDSSELLSKCYVEDSEGTQYPISDNMASEDATVPFAVSPVDKVGIVADSSNGLEWPWHYVILYR